MEKDESIQLTAADIDLLHEYIEAMEEIRKRKPAPVPDEIWDKVLPQIDATAQVPAEYRDIIGVEEYEDPDAADKDARHFRFYDIGGERWNKDVLQLTAKYNDIIVKCLKYTISKSAEPAPQDVLEMLQKLIADNKANLPAVIVQKLQNIDFPIDKVNRDIWGLLEYSSNGQTTFAKYDVSKRGSKKAVNILYSLDFTGLENVSITRKLEPYDKLVYLAVAARYNAGYDVMTIQQIYNDMGYSGRAGASDIEKINAALTKMKTAQLFIDNIAEAKSYKYDHFKYDGSLLPMERITAIINGQTAAAAVHIFREPPMVSFARERKQLTTIDIKLLNTPLNKTNANIALESYLIEEIARIKKGSRNNKMLYKTIYENTNIKTVKQRQRAPEKIQQLLEYYKDCGFIKAYKEVKDGIAIEY